VADGKVWYVEYAGNTIDVWDGSAKTVFWTQEGCGPSAVAPFGEGWLVTCYDAGTLVVVSSAGQTVKTYDKDSDGQALQGPNDIAVTPEGVYVTGSGPWESAPIVGKVWWLAPEAAAPKTVADDLHYANGLAVSPADGRLYLNESEAGRVISFAIGTDHGLSDRRLFARIWKLDEASGPDAYPDGMEFGPDGRLWVGQYSSGRILAIAPDGSSATAIEVPSPAAPNLAFSQDGKTLYVTAVDQFEAPYAGKVYAVPLP
jgi:sugar lactone lactonase YvrE